VQIFGLLLIVFTSLVVILAESEITIKVRFFYPLLKASPFKLHSKGIYKYVRHPMYAVFPLFILGSLLYTGQLVILPVIIFNLMTRSWYAKHEEEHLKKIVIGDYAHYMKQTPNRFYPKLF
jgi:protein-S-isoprenylcysteine O-methyltransferase Ste14